MDSIVFLTSLAARFAFSRASLLLARLARDLSCSLAAASSSRVFPSKRFTLFTRTLVRRPKRFAEDRSVMGLILRRMWQQPFRPFTSRSTVLFSRVSCPRPRTLSCRVRSWVSVFSKLKPGRAFQDAVQLLYCGVGGCLRFELDLDIIFRIV